MQRMESARASKCFLVIVFCSDGKGDNGDRTGQKEEEVKGFVKDVHRFAFVSFQYGMEYTGARGCGKCCILTTLSWPPDKQVKYRNQGYQDVGGDHRIGIQVFESAHALLLGGVGFHPLYYLSHHLRVGRHQPG